MKRLYLTVEGQTEAAFAVGVLPATWRPNMLLHPGSSPACMADTQQVLSTFGHALSDMLTWLKRPNPRTPDSP